MVTTITLEDDVWKKLAMMKLNTGSKTYSQLLVKIFNIINRMKLASNLEQPKQNQTKK